MNYQKGRLGTFVDLILWGKGMARLVSILILEKGEHELIAPAFIKNIERGEDFKVLQFSKMDLLDSAEEKKEEDEGK